MKNQVDFLKINGGVWGAINLNNMIPIHNNNLSQIDMRHLPTDNKTDTQYKNLLSNQLSWCNANKQMIISQATKLHKMITSGNCRTDLQKRCCDFTLDEKQYIRYCKLNNYPIKNNTSTKTMQERIEAILSTLPDGNSQGRKR